MNIWWITPTRSHNISQKSTAHFCSNSGATDKQSNKVLQERKRELSLSFSRSENPFFLLKIESANAAPALAPLRSITPGERASGEPVKIEITYRLTFFSPPSSPSLSPRNLVPAFRRAMTARWESETPRCASTREQVPTPT